MPTIAGSKRISADVLISPPKRRLRSNSSATSPNTPANVTLFDQNSLSFLLFFHNQLGAENQPVEDLINTREISARKLSFGITEKPKWNPSDPEHLSAVKEALHVSSTPAMVVCRENERNRILEFCKQCIESDKSGSLYACGCRGTGKSLSMERAGFQPPDVLAINCTSLTNTSEIFTKMLGENQPKKKRKYGTSPLEHLQRIDCQGHQSSGKKMMLIIADELDYLITKDRAVLHDLFMLTTLPFSRCILIGMANSIDLADRFLPRLQALSCKPTVVTFRAYTNDEIIKILQRRLMELPYTVFQPRALELCARKVAATSGDMRKALHICRSVIEILEAEMEQFSHDGELLPTMSQYSDDPNNPSCNFKKRGTDIVRVDYVAIALSKSYKSSVVDTIQSLPQHQQIILCSAVKHFRKGKKDTNIIELSRSYVDLCKSILIPPVGTVELSSMCRVLMHIFVMCTILICKRLRFVMSQ